MSNDLIYGIIIGIVGGCALSFLFFSFQGATINFDSVLATVNRIVASKKVIFMGCAIISGGITELTGHDITAKLNLWVAGGFVVLAAFQFVLDAIHGSSSDGTIKKTEVVKTTVVEEAKTEQPAVVVPA
jgi:hypothetical protein